MRLHLYCIIGLLSLGCSPKLPTCDAKQTKELLHKVLIEKTRLPDLMKRIGFTYRGIADHRQEKHEKDPERRICSVKIASDKGEERIFYHVAWKNKKEKRFGVRTLGNSLPGCTSFLFSKYVHRLVGEKLKETAFILSDFKEISTKDRIRVCGFSLLARGKTMGIKVQMTQTSEYLPPEMKILKK